MLISPPFLPPREADQSDADWLNVAMNSVSSNFIPELGNDTIAGAYPVSMELGWHGGMHLIAPPGEGGTTLPVRTIADGTIIFVRQPKVQNRNDDEPLNYGAPAGSSCWTSDGVVLIRHETDIGASPDGQAISVVFYSLYMHLDSISDGVKRNRRIYRKEELGSGGYIYGQPHRIHFEIFCDDENLQRLSGRQSGELPLGADGRNSVVFGEMYFHLPVGSHVYSKQPLANQTTPTDSPAYTTVEDLFVGLRYAEGDGTSVSVETPPSPPTTAMAYSRVSRSSNATPNTTSMRRPKQSRRPTQQPAARRRVRCMNSCVSVESSTPQTKPSRHRMCRTGARFDTPVVKAGPISTPRTSEDSVMPTFLTGKAGVSS